MTRPNRVIHWLDRIVLLALITAAGVVLLAVLFLQFGSTGQEIGLAPTHTPSQTATTVPTTTPTDTPTEPPTARPSETPTDTPTATDTPTDEPSATLTETATATHTAAPSETPTDTPAPTETPSSTATATEEPLFTATPDEALNPLAMDATATREAEEATRATAAIAQAATQTSTTEPTVPANTAIPTEAPSDTPEPTAEPSATPTDAPTETETPAPTATPAPTETSVPSETPTDTPTPTETMIPFMLMVPEISEGVPAAEAIVLRGQGPAGKTVQIINEAGELLGETTVAENGTWSFTLRADPTQNGAYAAELTVQVITADGELLAASSEVVTLQGATATPPPTESPVPTATPTDLPTATQEVADDARLSVQPRITSPTSGTQVGAGFVTFQGDGPPGQIVAIAEDGIVLASRVVNSTGSWYMAVDVSSVQGEAAFTLLVIDEDDVVIAQSPAVRLEVIGQIAPPTGIERHPDDTHTRLPAGLILMTLFGIALIIGGAAIWQAGQLIGLRSRDDVA